MTWLTMVGVSHHGAPHSGAGPDDIRAVVEVRMGQAAAEHLFDVAAGLRSRVLGEVEILAQPRSAFHEARAAGMPALYRAGCSRRRCAPVA